MNNLVVIIGNIVRNIELRTLPSGKNTCNVTLAIKRNYKNEKNEYETDFITCKAYGLKAETISKYCKKGDTIGIKGTILTGSYEKDGKKVYTTDVMIQEISFLKQSKKEEETKTQEVKEDPFEQFSNEVQINSEDLPF